MKKNAQRLCLIISITAMLSIYSSCTPEDDSVKAEAVGNKVSLDKEDASGNNIEEQKQEDSSMYSVIDEPKGKDFLLYHEVSLMAVYPEDFEIGSLQNKIDLDANELEIYSLVSAFAASIFEDDIDADLVYSVRRDFVMRNLEDSLDNMELSDFRLGIIDIDSEPAMADIRFIENDKFIDGTIYFIREGSWKIYDLQLNNPDNSLKEKVNTEKWFPIYN